MRGVGGEQRLQPARVEHEIVVEQRQELAAGDGRAAIVGLLLVMLIGHWWLHYATVIGNAEQAAVFFPWPLALGLALLLGRRWLVTPALPGAAA